MSGEGREFREQGFELKGVFDEGWLFLGGLL